jgi:hypothetical protein
LPASANAKFAGIAYAAAAFVNRMLIDRCARDAKTSAERADSASHGLRVFRFGKKKIFMINGDVGHRRPLNRIP